MTVATDLGRCTWASCREKATSSNEQGWNFCDEHTAADAELQQEADHVIKRPAAQPLPRPTPLSSVPTTPHSPASTASAASPIGLLLEQASGHSVARVRNLASRIEKHLADLRALIAEHAKEEESRRRAEAARARARAEVERLEEQLRAAKAKLTGKPASPASTAARISRPGNAGGMKTCRTCGEPATRLPGVTTGIWPSRCPKCRGAAA